MLKIFRFWRFFYICKQYIKLFFILFVTFGASGYVDMPFSGVAKEKMCIKMTVQRNVLMTYGTNSFHARFKFWVAMWAAHDCAGLVFVVTSFVDP